MDEFKLIGSGLTDKATSLIRSAVTRYETETPKPDCRSLDRAAVSWYRGLLMFIGDMCKDLDIRNVQDLDSLFKKVYVPLSLRYGITPKINDFCLMLGTDYSVIDRLLNNSNNPLYKDIYSNWLIICRESLIADMIDSYSSNINHIFISKAVYGLTDKETQAETTPKTAVKRDRDSIIAELSGGIVENPGNVEN